MEPNATPQPLIIFVKMINHCRRALADSGEPLPNFNDPPNASKYPSKYLMRLRRIARARRLSNDGLIALEQICAIWEPALQKFGAGEIPLRFTEYESQELASQIRKVEAWLKTNFPKTFPEIQS